MSTTFIAKYLTCGVIGALAEVLRPISGTLLAVTPLSLITLSPLAIALAITLSPLAIALAIAPRLVQSLIMDVSRRDGDPTTSTWLHSR